MNWKRRLLKKNFSLYVIVDKKVLKNGCIFTLVDKIKDAGVDVIQFRDKVSSKDNIIRNSQALRKLLAKSKTLFIINDYLDVAKIVDCDGIHLGQDDLPLKIARRLLGKDKLIGVSCHNLKQALKAQKEGADYISIGPVFATPLKPGHKTVGLDLIKRVKRKVHIPFFAIGGINQTNIRQVLDRGAKNTAVCRAICQTRNPKEATRKLKTLINRDTP